MKIKVQDTIRVIAGKDRGKEGKVLRTLKKKGQVIVEGVNMRTKHIKKSATQAGQIVKYEAAINVSNVMIIDPKSKKPSRIGYLIGKNGKKIRISRKSGEVLDTKSAKKSTTKK